MKSEIWSSIDYYLREGVITPINGEYILQNRASQFTYRADIIGSLVLTFIGPTQWRPTGLGGEIAIEPKVVADLLGFYSAREIALLECLYEGQIFTWDVPYLTNRDIFMLNQPARDYSNLLIGDDVKKVEKYVKLLPNAKHRLRHFVNTMKLAKGKITAL